MARSRRALLSAGGAAGLSMLAACSGAEEPAATEDTSAPLDDSSSAPTTRPPSDTPAPSPTSTPRPAVAGRPGPDITSGPGGRSELALTFHGAGSPDLTLGVIEALAASGARATIFAVGRWVTEDPSQVLALRDAGHEIGNHTYDHPDMLGLDPARAKDQISRGREVLAATLGDAGWWFRPSGTAHSNETIRAAANELGYGPCIGYDVDPEDFRDPGADLVRDRTLATAKAGSIVSLHLGHVGTVTALPGILASLRDRGLGAVTLSTLLRD